MWNLNSRAHRLNHFPNDEVQCYVKRDDELSCGISGTKLRKYASLVPKLIEQSIQHLLIIAGPQSNNLLAALQIAREHQLQVTAFLLKPRGNQNEFKKGNFKLSQLFLNDTEIVWVERNQWVNVNVLAQEYQQRLSHSSFILNEGASVAEAMPGAKSLAADIHRNELDLGIQFDHIFIDAGTGFSAVSLILGLAELMHQACVHVLLLAETESTFIDHLNHWQRMNQTPLNRSKIRCFFPPTARSFGAINQSIKDEIHQMAHEEGILTDPIYSAKLFFSARNYITEQKLKGTILIIHSGGILSLPNFDL